MTYSDIKQRWLLAFFSTQPYSFRRKRCFSRGALKYDWPASLGLLLRDAMNVAAAEQDLPRLQADDLVIRKQFRQFPPRVFIVSIIELRQDDAAIRRCRN